MHARIDRTASASRMAISIEDISKSYGPAIVLASLSLDIEPGEFVSLLGPSGSGKTTLLNIIAGFIPPDTGRLFLGGRDVSFLPPHKRGLGMVFQNYALFPHMSVARNVEFPLRARKYTQKERQRRVERTLELVRLAGFGDRRIGELSGGQRQRVALARAVVFDPTIILMDEPLSALDKQLREEMQVELRQLHEKLGATTIYVTHDQREALTMSDRIAVMKDGKLIQVDTPRDLYNRPKTAFVAQFIGETTLIPASPVGPMRVSVPGTQLQTAEQVRHGRQLLVLRAEKISLAEPHNSINRFEAMVSSTVYQGDSVLVLAELPGGIRLSIRLSIRHGDGVALPLPGRLATFYVDPKDTVLVPAD